MKLVDYSTWLPQPLLFFACSESHYPDGQPRFRVPSHTSSFPHQRDSCPKADKQHTGRAPHNASVARLLAEEQGSN